MAPKESVMKASNDKNDGLCPYWIIWEEGAGKSSGNGPNETPRNGVAKVPGKYRFAI